MSTSDGNGTGCSFLFPSLLHIFAFVILYTRYFSPISKGLNQLGDTLWDAPKRDTLNSNNFYYVILILDFTFICKSIAIKRSFKLKL